MKKKEEASWQKVLLAIVMLIISIPAIGISAYLYEKSFRDIFILLIIVTACFGMTLFSFFQSIIFQALHYDNGGHLSRFVITFLMGTAAACLLPMLPEAGWILPVAALALTLFSNTVTGLTAYAGLMCVCAYFSSADIITFLMYFLTGVLFAVLFERLDNDYRTGAPMLVAVIIYVTEIAAKVIFQSHGTMSADELIIPIMNVFVTFILMLAILRFYCAVVIDKEKGRYLRINDQEYELLAKYKEEDRQTYFNAIHTAYFAEKTARLLHMDVDVAKNGGYYHRIIVLEC
ncbi:MAG: hypothetical protein K2I96_18715, partial [Lachnospiraceae bacterium]|nr:hypothetical protein [Lachnospiraceae bacterium]